MAGWFDAAAKLTGPYYDVVVAGEPGDPLTRKLVTATLATLPANAVLSAVPASGAEERLRELAPATAGKRAQADAATAYVCEFGTCQPPTSDAKTLREQLRTGWAH
jgi:uncharacterized protein YyaL (SSP411 family)